MLTSKQRAYLRGLAAKEDTIIQIGKEGMSDQVIAAIDEALEKRELLKIAILETAMLDTREACNEAAERLGAEPVQAIGNKFVLYRRSSNEKNRRIELPRR